MSFTFSLSDTVAAYLERFPEAPGALKRLHIDPIRDLSRSMANCGIGEQNLDDLAACLQASRWHEDEDWTTANLEDLVLHISSAHHTYLTSELPRLLRLTRRLEADGAVTNGLDARLRSLSNRLLAHLEREESELFPVCRALGLASHGAALPNSRLLRLGTNDLEVGHEDIERELPLLLALTAECTDHKPLPGLCQALRLGLEALKTDLLQHHYEEEDCLIPAALHWQEVLSRPVLRKDSGQLS